MSVSFSSSDGMGEYGYTVWRWDVYIVCSQERYFRFTVSSWKIRNRGIEVDRWMVKKPAGPIQQQQQQSFIPCHSKTHINETDHCLYGCTS